MFNITTKGSIFACACYIISQYYCFDVSAAEQTTDSTDFQEMADQVEENAEKYQSKEKKRKRKKKKRTSSANSQNSLLQRANQEREDDNASEVKNEVTTNNIATQISKILSNITDEAKDEILNVMEEASQKTLDNASKSYANVFIVLYKHLTVAKFEKLLKHLTSTKALRIEMNKVARALSNNGEEKPIKEMIYAAMRNARKETVPKDD